MPGPLAEVRTQIAANRLDISRQLNMGDGVVLRLSKADATQPSGVTVIRDYDSSFDEVRGLEREVSDGETIVVDIADTFPEGQLQADLREAEYFQFVQGTIISPMYGGLDIPKISPFVPQIYRITAKTETFKQAYFRSGHGSPRR